MAQRLSAERAPGGGWLTGGSWGGVPLTAVQGGYPLGAWLRRRSTRLPALLAPCPAPFPHSAGVLSGGLVADAAAQHRHGHRLRGPTTRARPGTARWVPRKRASERPLTNLHTMRRKTVGAGLLLPEVHGNAVLPRNMEWPGRHLPTAPSASVTPRIRAPVHLAHRYGVCV